MNYWLLLCYVFQSSAFYGCAAAPSSPSRKYGGGGVIIFWISLRRWLASYLPLLTFHQARALKFGTTESLVDGFSQWLSQNQMKVLGIPAFRCFSQPKAFMALGKYKIIFPIWKSFSAILMLFYFIYFFILEGLQSTVQRRAVSRVLTLHLSRPATLVNLLL